MKVVQLGEVAGIERSAVDPTRLHHDTPYLGLEDIERGGRILSYRSVGEAAPSSTKFAFTTAHVLYGKLRPNLGKISRPTRDGVCSTDILPISPGADLDRDYLALFLQQPSMIAFAVTHTGGANLPRVSPRSLESLEIPLPPLSEQRRIAAVLDQADAIRAERHRQVLLLDETVESAFAEIQESSVSATILGELIAEGPTNGLYKPGSDYGAGVPILRIDGFESGRMRKSPWKRVRASPSEIERYGLRKDDIVINRVNAMSHLGKSVRVPRLPEPSVYESNMMRIRLGGEIADPRFVGVWLQHPSTKRQILAKAKEAINQASVNQSDILNLRIPRVSLARQIEFGNFVDHIEAQRARIEAALAKDDELFAALQYRAFRGEL